MPKCITSVRRTTGLMILTFTFPLLLADCSGGSPTAGPTAAPATVTVTRGQSTDAPLSSADPTSTDAATPNNDPSSTGPSILGTEATGSTLTLAQFFQPDATWADNRFDIADRRQVPGIGNQVAVCTRDTAPNLELRLADNFNSLRFEVGQANDSQSSDQILTVEVMGDRGQIDIQKVPFNEIRKMAIPVKGVNALKILFYLVEDSKVMCGSKTVSVVIFNAVLS
jgi:hypothetical protein